MVEIQWHSQTKERATENTNFNLHRRASPRPYLREAGGFRRPTQPGGRSRHAIGQTSRDFKGHSAARLVVYPALVINKSLINQ